MRCLQAVTGPAKVSERRMNFCTIADRKFADIVGGKEAEGV